jgi:hypothetical protein
MTQSNSRYQNKPFLRLTEFYVLWAIGHLSEKDAGALEQMTPSLRSIYKTQGTWQDIVSTALDLPENMPALITECWATNTEIAKKHDTSLAPQQFAEMFVDENLD